MNIAPKTVVTCYDFFDIMYVAGIGDLTDGKYPIDSKTDYKNAQQLQAEYLLDQIDCKEGSRILDVGCGYGRILASAEARGATATGITISPIQIKRLKKLGLDAQLINYRNIPHSWDGTFDGIVANGSIEHFVQPDEALEGKTDQLYEELFAIFSRLLKPGGKVATTVIHQNFHSTIDPKEVLKGSRAHKKGTEIYHCAKLAEDFGGWYPMENQFDLTSQKYFKHIHREDGTEDYHLTSEYWLGQIWRQAYKPKVWLSLTSLFIRHPKATASMIDDILIQQTWMWQFRVREDGTTPTKLFRDTWLKQ